MPKEGDQVIATGELSVYVPRGGYQLVIKELQFLGVGELLLKTPPAQGKASSGGVGSTP